MADTSALRTELEKTNACFNRWVDGQSNWLESTESDFTRTMEECECTLAALKENELELETLREQNDTTKKAQKEEIDYYIQQKKILIEQEKELLPKLRKLEEEEEKENIRLNGIRKEHETLLLQAERSIDDLTHGIRMYAGLGLEFQKAEGQCMKFIFTLIDPYDTAKQFFFKMFVDDNDKYQLVECQPAVPAPFTTKVLADLNSDNDIGKFVVKMRKAFQGIAAKR
jgi:hypothetical protein